MSRSSFRIATRASNLALWQARHVAQLLTPLAGGLAVELVSVTTTGDRDTAQPLEQFGGVGVFTREVQRAVLEERADLAVHSLKDLPTDKVEGLALAGVPPRASALDVLVLPTGQSSPGSLDLLPKNARIGTGSLRRRAQLLHLRPDFQMRDVRGNVETRLKKLDAGDYDALVLAEAGLVRLGLAGRISAILGPPVLYPAVGQGALGIECRSDDGEVVALLRSITDASTLAAVTAERRVLADLRAGCHAPLGVATQVEGKRLELEAVVLSRDGRERCFVRIEGSAEHPDELGMTAAEELRRQGADSLLQP